MKAISPTVIALVLWLLFWVTNAFALIKPYPRKAQRPDEIIVISDGRAGLAVGTASKPK
jgi:hypothetical protein